MVYDTIAMNIFNYQIAWRLNHNGLLKVGISNQYSRCVDISINRVGCWSTHLTPHTTSTQVDAGFDLNG